MFAMCNTIAVLLFRSTQDEPLPTEFRWAYKISRCTHGVSQSSRSKGHRNRKTRYCGCRARFAAVVTSTDGNEFMIRLSMKQANGNVAERCLRYSNIAILGLEPYPLAPHKCVSSFVIPGNENATFERTKS
jgi:hypothetical protein